MSRDLYTESKPTKRVLPSRKGTVVVIYRKERLKKHVRSAWGRFVRVIIRFGKYCAKGIDNACKRLKKTP